MRSGRWYERFLWVGRDDIHSIFRRRRAISYCRDIVDVVRATSSEVSVREKLVAWVLMIRDVIHVAVVDFTWWRGNGWRANPRSPAHTVRPRRSLSQRCRRKTLSSLPRRSQGWWLPPSPATVCGRRTVWHKQRAATDWLIRLVIRRGSRTECNSGDHCREKSKRGTSNEDAWFTFSWDPCSVAAQGGERARNGGQGGRGRC